MKLKYIKNVTGSICTVNLSLVNLTSREKKAIRVLGAPELNYEEAFSTSGTTVSISCRIDEFNNLEPFVFQGDIDNIADVLDEVASFIASVHDALQDLMTDLMTSYKTVEKITNSSSGEIFINDGDCHFSEEP